MRQRWKVIGWLFIISIICLQGCQQNPDGDIVQNKNDGNLEEGIHKQAEGAAEEVAEWYTDSFKNSAGDVLFTVDAEVQQAEREIPVVRVTSREITAEDLQLWAEVLFEGNTAYEPQTELSKSEIEAEILWRKQRLNDRDDLVAEYGDDEEAIAIVIEEYEWQIARYEEQYEHAPDTVERVESDWSYHSDFYYQPNSFTNDESLDEKNEALTLQFQAQTAPRALNDYTGFLRGAERSEDDFEVHNLWFYYLDGEDMPYKEVSKEESFSVAEETRIALAMDDWELQDVIADEDIGRCRYSFIFSPVFEGVAAIGGAGIFVDSEETYGAVLAYEELYIEVSNGILTGVQLENPMHHEKMENDNVATLSFDEVYALFQSQMQSEYTWTSFIPEGVTEEEYPEEFARYKEAECEVKITKIQQGMFRVQEKDSDEYLMIPVWAFYGTAYVDGEEEITAYFSIINAIDGTTINSGLGY